MSTESEYDDVILRKEYVDLNWFVAYDDSGKIVILRKEYVDLNSCGRRVPLLMSKCHTP